MIIGHILRAAAALKRTGHGDDAHEAGPDPMQAAFGDASLLGRKDVARQVQAAQPAATPETLRPYM